MTQLQAHPVTSWQFRHHLTNLKWPSKCLASLMDMSPLGFQMTREWYMLLYLLMRYQQAQRESADLFYLIYIKTFNKQTFIKCGMCWTLGVMGVGLDACYVSIHCKHPSRCHHFGHIIFHLKHEIYLLNLFWRTSSVSTDSLLCNSQQTSAKPMCDFVFPGTMRQHYVYMGLRSVLFVFPGQWRHLHLYKEQRWRPRSATRLFHRKRDSKYSRTGTVRFHSSSVPPFLTVVS